MDTGIARAQLGEATAAEPLIADALRREPVGNQRGRAFHTFWLATTQLQQGKVEEACHTATTALETATVVGSERITGHLREFHQRLAPFNKEPTAITFEARLRASPDEVGRGRMRPEAARSSHQGGQTPPCRDQTAPQSYAWPEL